MLVLGTAKQRGVTRGTTAQWDRVATRVFGAGKLLVDTDLGTVKLTDGTTAVADLVVTDYPGVTDVRSVSTVVHGDAL